MQVVTYPAQPRQLFQSRGVVGTYQKMYANRPMKSSEHFARCEDGRIKMRRSLKNHSPEHKYGRKKSFHYEPVLLKIGTLAFCSLAVSMFFVLKPKAAVTKVTPSYSKKTYVSPRDVVKNFLDAKTNTERLAFVRNAKEVSQAMNDFFENGLGKNEHVLSMKPYKLPNCHQESSLVNDSEQSSFIVRFKEGGARLLLTTITDDGYKIDFPAYARLGSDSWDSILKGNAEEATVRVMMKEDHFFLGQFSDEKNWQCFQADSSDVSTPLYFYLDKKSVADHVIQEDDFIQPTFCTLVIRQKNDSNKSNQFEIVKILNKSWMID